MEEENNEDDSVWNASAVILDIDSGVSGVGVRFTLHNTDLNIYQKVRTNTAKTICLFGSSIKGQVFVLFHIVVSKGRVSPLDNMMYQSGINVGRSNH